MEHKKSKKLLLKYRQAGLWFFILNMLYLVIVFIFLPSFYLNLSAIISFLVYLIIISMLSYYLFKGMQLLALFLAIVFGLRSIVSTYTLITGQTFPAVPYTLPLLLIIFYLLGRLAWKWP